MKIFKFILIFSVALITLSCIKDEGNYEYKTLNDVEISGFKPINENEGVYITEHNDILEIKPQVTQKLSNEPSKLAYAWKIGQDTVSREKDLNYKVSGRLPFGKISCLYIVTDKSNGMKYFKTFSINITNPFSFGWYVLTEKPDKNSEIAHLSTTRPDAKFIYTDAISGYKLGKPVKLEGKFGYISSLSDYFWTIYVTTKDCEYPFIQTENATFMANYLVSSNNFMDKDKGYSLNPDEFYISRSGATVFVSGGKTIFLTSGVLYKPAKYLKDYFFTNVTPNAMNTYAIAFDKIGKKLCKLEPIEDNISQGIFGDKYSMDQVTEFDNSADFQSRKIGYIVEPSSTIKSPSFRIVSSSSQGIHFDRFSIGTDKIQTRTPECVLQIAGADENTRVLPAPNGYSPSSWYFSIGSKIYSSPDLLPALTEFAAIPSSLGAITDMKLSAKATELVVSTYNAGSTNSYKGSLVIINIVSKKMTIYENVMHKPISILAADANPWW